MNKTFKLFGMIAAVAIVGFSVTGCDTGNGNGGINAIRITDLTPAHLYQSAYIAIYGVFPVGTTQVQVEATINALLGGQNPPHVVAGANDHYHSLQLAGTTVTVPLYSAPGFNSRWSGSGAFDVWIILGRGGGSGPGGLIVNAYQSTSAVAFDGGTVTVSASAFTHVVTNANF